MEGGRVRASTYTELEVYGLAFQAAMELFEISKAFPRDERYSLTDQLRRSSRSVCANIAEAWHRRIYPNAFRSKLTDSAAEAAETQTWIQFAVACRYVTEQRVFDLQHRYRFIVGKLIVMMNAADQWRV